MPDNADTTLHARKPTSTVSIIAAMSENRVIGVRNALPWHLPADLRHFRSLTMGHTVIAGRKNYESIGRPLPGRTNIIVTRDPAYRAPGCTVVHSIDAALEAAGADNEIFVIGGAQIYEQTIRLAERMYLTLVHARIEGDAFFPPFDPGEWNEIEREQHAADERHVYAYTFITLVRKHR